MLPLKEEIKIGIVGLGYVGLPLAVEFGRYYQTIGFDISSRRIEQLRLGFDVTREVDSGGFANASLLSFAGKSADLADCNVYIITVPTPVDASKQPDLSYLISASSSIGALLKSDDVVIYESTVFPGATEECCVPVLEKCSSLAFNKDFYVGYSPERINPGDKERSLTAIVKVTSGSTEESAEFIDDLYASIIVAGTHKASSIKVAEAAKVIENTQRDINIALINELAILFNRLGIETDQVLAAACTKWNFLPFKPGLVGGHCIGVDPYYLTHKAQAVGYYPEMILAGRKINDSMSGYVVDQVVKLMTESRIHVVDA
ncbi:MAG: nucleotide sugar dehydrogenase, partial [Gammaproteobacteria bacterium]|nr:nucleotide sugar dehydrogenase [Gammaproteobacteria bacterium]